MSKADFRALRETVGHTVQSFADEIGVNQRTVRRWERPAEEWEAPDDAWDVLEEEAERQRQAVDFMVGKAMAEREKHPDLAEVRVTYWSTREAFARAHPDDDGPAAYLKANAISRLVAFELEREGVTVLFEYES